MMQIKTRTALLSTGCNAVLTVCKFALWWLTGSLAILAEAWHSLADIATSLLVLVAVTRPRVASTEPAAADEAERSGRRPFSWVTRFLGRADAEHWAGLAIGLFLALVGLGLLVKVGFGERQPIERPLLSGLLFLGFSVGSYFVFRFETAVGRRHGSVGLVSDGMHSRADMLGALLAGGAMILYSAGIDVDRPVAILISLFVLSFGIETLATAVRSALAGTGRTVTRWRTVDLAVALTRRETLRKLGSWADRATPPSFARGLRRLRDSLGLVLRLAAAVALLLWLSTAIYSVGTAERALVERLGRPLAPERPIEAGLHLKLPWPIDRALRVDVHSIRRQQVANLTDTQAFALLWTREHGSEEAFLSGDNTFFFPYLILHYRVRDPADYLIRHVNADELLDSVAHSTVSTLFSSLSFDEIVGRERGALEQRIAAGIQAELDSLHAGLEIIAVCFRDVHPPIFIADAFERVIAARQEKEQMINEALGYRNGSLPEARGTAAREVAAARGYVARRTQHSRGDAGRFVSRLPASPGEERITRRRLALDTLSETLAAGRTVLVDPAAGTPGLLLEGVGGAASVLGEPQLLAGDELPAER